MYIWISCHSFYQLWSFSLHRKISLKQQLHAMLLCAYQCWILKFTLSTQSYICICFVVAVPVPSCYNIVSKSLNGIHYFGSCLQCALLLPETLLNIYHEIALLKWNRYTYFFLYLFIFSIEFAILVGCTKWTKRKEKEMN